MQRIDNKTELLIATELKLRAMLVSGLAGDARAYHDFLQALSTHLRAFLRRRLQRWPDDVEDLLQEALLAIHNQRHTYDMDAPLTAWVHAIAKYKMIDWLRRREGREMLNDPLTDATEQAAELFSSADADAADARRDLDQLLAQLPEQQRTAIVHTKLEGLSVRETAELTGMSESAIKVAVHRGLKALAARMRGNE
ncbi:sigma-70 family RNA polymerase sigma factor [Oxalobacteraceae bacterium CAVE-383]|nr:sigma-70 family RNA polymerase sigma factor [Oxalobacteraceae bacterium CAVE-383]